MDKRYLWKAGLCNCQGRWDGQVGRRAMASGGSVHDFILLTEATYKLLQLWTGALTRKEETRSHAGNVGSSTIFFSDFKKERPHFCVPMSLPLNARKAPAPRPPTYPSELIARIDYFVSAEPSSSLEARYQDFFNSLCKKFSSLVK